VQPSWRKEKKEGEQDAEEGGVLFLLDHVTNVIPESFYYQKGVGEYAAS
jgi:hypothetical protein